MKTFPEKGKEHFSCWMGKPRSSLPKAHNAGSLQTMTCRISNGPWCHTPSQPLAMVLTRQVCQHKPKAETGKAETATIIGVSWQSHCHEGSHLHQCLGQRWEKELQCKFNMIEQFAVSQHDVCNSLWDNTPRDRRHAQGPKMASSGFTQGVYLYYSGEQAATLISGYSSQLASPEGFLSFRASLRLDCFPNSTMPHDSWIVSPQETKVKSSYSNFLLETQLPCRVEK